MHARFPKLVCFAPVSSEGGIFEDGLLQVIVMTMVYIQNVYEKVVPIITNKTMKWSVAFRASFPLLMVVRSAQNSDFDCTFGGIEISQLCYKYTR